MTAIYKMIEEKYLVAFRESKHVFSEHTGLALVGQTL